MLNTCTLKVSFYRVLVLEILGIQLRTGKKLSFQNGHPIQLVVLIGFVITFEAFFTFQIHCLDDASSLTWKGPTSTNTATLMTYKSKWSTLQVHSRKKGVSQPFITSTAFKNMIPCPLGNFSKTCVETFCSREGMEKWWEDSSKNRNRETRSLSILYI